MVIFAIKTCNLTTIKASNITHSVKMVKSYYLKNLIYGLKLTKIVVTCASGKYEEIQKFMRCPPQQQTTN